MRTHDKLPKKARLWALGAMLTILVLLMGATSYAATLTYYLKAGVWEIPKGSYHAANPQLPTENVLMWGYAVCDSTFAHCGAVTTPGPVLYANENDTLTINLKNSLIPPGAVPKITPTAYPSMYKEPTSLVINGQTPSAWAPVWVSVSQDGVPHSVTSNGSRKAGDVTSRVRSFNAETAANKIGTYTWNSLKPGAYLYESGTHPAVQVQMGLYGALVVYPAVANATDISTHVPLTPATPGTVTRTLPGSPQAYNDPSTAFNSEVALVYSEVDQELHYSIASGRYGQAPHAPPGAILRGQRTSTIDYAPNFFLINGTPFTSTGAPTPIPNAGVAGQKTLLRFLNAGLLEKTPTLLNLYMSLIAEDGNPFTYNSPSTSGIYYSKQQYSFLMGAGTRMDAIVTPTAAGNAPLFDRSLNLTNGSWSPQGMGGDLAYLQVTSGVAQPVNKVAAVPRK